MNKLSLPVIIAACSQLIACGGSGQDNGSISEFSQQYTGIAIDGYLARSTVYLDSNNNGTRDPWESFAFTDNQGHYSYNPQTDTDYCASTASAEEQQYCLTSNRDLTDVVIRIDGGYDILTGEPFVGQLSRRVLDEDRNSTILITPLTSLLTEIRDSSARTQLLDNLSLTETDLNTNYLDTNGSGEIDERLLNTALKVHKSVIVLADRLQHSYHEIGENYGTPNDPSPSIYDFLARELSTTTNTLDTALTNENSLLTILDNAETHLREIYASRDLTLPADLGSIESPTTLLRTTDVVANIPILVNTLINPNTELTPTLAIGAARSLEAVVIKALSENGGLDTSIDNAVTFFTNENNEFLIDALVNSLSQETADTAGLARNDFQGNDFDSEEEIMNASQLPDDAEPFTNLPGQSLQVSDLNLGSTPDQLDDSEVAFYFQGEAGDTSGRFAACVKFIQGANIDGTLGEGNTRGERVEGYWSLLGGDESFNLLLTIELFGTSYAGILKSSGFAVIDNINYQLVRGDADGDFRTWHSELGLITTEGELPATNTECEARLPSRIGI